MRDLGPFIDLEGNSFKILSAIKHRRTANTRQIQQTLDRQGVDLTPLQIEIECENLYRRGILCKIDDDYAIDIEWLKKTLKFVEKATNAYNKELKKHGKKSKG